MIPDLNWGFWGLEDCLVLFSVRLSSIVGCWVFFKLYLLSFCGDFPIFIFLFSHHLQLRLTPSLNLIKKLTKQKKTIVITSISLRPVWCSVNVTKYCPHVNCNLWVISPETPKEGSIYHYSMKYKWDFVRHWSCLRPQNLCQRTVKKHKAKTCLQWSSLSAELLLQRLHIKTKTLPLSRQCKRLDLRLNVRLQIRTSKAKTALGLALHIHRVTWHTILPLP